MPHLLASQRRLPYALLGIILVTLSLLEDFHAVANAAPSPSPPAFHVLSLSKSTRPQRNMTEWGTWAKFQRERLSVKYEDQTNGTERLVRRGNGMNLLTNQNADSSYFGSMTVGTPPVSYNVILDTGSSDLWLATEGAFPPDQSQTPGYDPSLSSSYEPMNVSFSIKYGSGGAAGVLGKETVQMAGFTVDDQTFGVVSDMSASMLQSPVSGLLGLGFQNIAASRAVPFWLNVAAQPDFLDEAVMGFHLTRYVNDMDARSAEPGGSFIFGAVNQSLYTGDIDYVSIPEGRVGYWTLELTSIVSQNITVPLPSSPVYAAVDTGTTLVGGPASMIAQLYQTIPGSEPGTGDYDGYYTYPCNTTVSVSLRFGNSSILWPISPADFKLAQLSSETCLGGFFEFKTSSTTGPTWIIGDTFLKNVYSVFRAAPEPAVGFAQLSPLAESMNGKGGALPTPTYAANGAAVTAQDGLSRTNDSSPRTSHSSLILYLSFLSALVMSSLYAA